MEKFNFENQNVLKEEVNEFKDKLDSLIFEAINNKDRQQLRHLIVGGHINKKYFNELLKKYNNASTEYKEVIYVDEMLDLLIPEEKINDKKLENPNFTYIDKVILPTKNGTASIKPGQGKFEKSVEIQRIDMFVELLNNLGITPDKYECIVGQNDQEMMRTLSYVMFVLKDIKKMIFVCNEEGNATYVIYGECDSQEKYYSLSKDEIQNLISSQYGKKIIWTNEENWEKEILEEIKNISNNDISKLSNEELKKILNIEKKEEFYNFEEAKEAVKRLGIQSWEQYVRQGRYKEDSRLPSNPNVFYEKFWDDWTDFLGKEKRVEPYESIEEAKEAVKRLGIKSQSEYHKRYKEDSRLPSNPVGNNAYYKERKEKWTDFLGKEKRVEPYESIEEAKEAVKRLGIMSIYEYRDEKRYKEDPRLITDPIRIYRNKGWNGWSDFLGKNK